MTKRKLGIILVTGIVLLVTIFGFLIRGEILSRRYKKLEYSSEHSIEKILDIEELHMANLPYKGKTERIVETTKKNGQTESRCLYHVVYKGNVLLGTTERLAASIDEENKCITVSIPDPKILDLSVDFNSIDYIFEKGRFESETISQDSYQLCLNDMRKNLEMDKGLIKNAKRNTENFVLGLLKPLYEGYDIQFN